ncbi:hypothetical protein [Hyphomicrobium sp.]|jgi:hypothetical protein|uniref:hypothetical protein n=1 Tax=Hyphomicrobium sp. TaxID=82 RepID=UPI003561E4A8
MWDMDVAGGARLAHIVHDDMDRRKAQQQRRAVPQATSRVTWKRHQQLVQPVSLIKTAHLILVVLAASALVHVSRARAAEAADGPKLPAHVADLRDAILSAARSGNIEDLNSAFDVSGAVPDLGVSPRSDPIKALKDRSEDPQGRDTLAAMVAILEMPPVALPLGNDIENNLIYVWPYLSMRSLDKLTPSEQVDLYRLVTPAQAAEMREKKRWLWWRLVIAADGTWTMFKKGN